MILVMFNDSEGAFPPVACCEGKVDSLCDDLSVGMYEGIREDEEESDEAK